MKNLCYIGLLIFAFVFIPEMQGKKIRSNLRIDKSRADVLQRNDKVSIGTEINLTDTATYENPEIEELVKRLRIIDFAGYDKEPNSDKESFILVNKSNETIKGFLVRIDYLDMKGRMIHSREIKEECLVPSEESRRFDIRSWDKQRTYFYYLGNEPKKVATPFQVKFIPLKYWIE